MMSALLQADRRSTGYTCAQDMRPGLVPTKMFAVVQACALPHIAVLEKNVSSIWFRQAEMI